MIGRLEVVETPGAFSGRGVGADARPIGRRQGSHGLDAIGLIRRAEKGECNRAVLVSGDAGDEMSGWHRRRDIGRHDEERVGSLHAQAARIIRRIVHPGKCQRHAVVEKEIAQPRHGEIVGARAGQHDRTAESGRREWAAGQQIVGIEIICLRAVPGDCGIESRIILLEAPALNTIRVGVYVDSESRRLMDVEVESGQVKLEIGFAGKFKGRRVIFYHNVIHGRLIDVGVHKRAAADIGLDASGNVRGNQLRTRGRINRHSH